MRYTAYGVAQSSKLPMIARAPPYTNDQKVDFILAAV